MGIIKANFYPFVQTVKQLISLPLPFGSTSSSSTPPPLSQYFVGYSESELSSSQPGIRVEMSNSGRCPLLSITSQLENPPKGKVTDHDHDQCA